MEIKRICSGCDKEFEFDPTKDEDEHIHSCLFYGGYFCSKACHSKNYHDTEGVQDNIEWEVLKPKSDEEFEKLKRKTEETYRKVVLNEN
ncbi:hypothetical protein LCGC14_1061710 [marine sediment metagenome]|uniref:Uncharacterized protein n=1 Tax=marine sediment metagenome TaxID=412755 RepID=A0A0F9N7X4_9ZZZZ